MHQQPTAMESILAERLLDQIIGVLDTALREDDDDLEAAGMLKDYVESKVQDRFVNSAKRLLVKYYNGGLTKADLVTEIQKRFQREGTRAFLVGKHSIGSFGMTKTDRAALAAEFKRDFARMELVPGPEWPKRLRLYSAKLRGFSQLGRLRSYQNKQFDPDTICWWTLGDAEHCEDCEGLADDSPFRVADLVAQNLFPASGHTRCGNNCKCTLIFEKPMQAGRPVSTKSMGGYRVRDEGIGGLWWLG